MPLAVPEVIVRRQVVAKIEAQSERVRERNLCASAEHPALVHVAAHGVTHSTQAAVTADEERRDPRSWRLNDQEGAVAVQNPLIVRVLDVGSGGHGLGLDTEEGQGVIAEATAALAAELVLLLGVAVGPDAVIGARDEHAAENAELDHVGLGRQARL